MRDNGRSSVGGDRGAPSQVQGDSFRIRSSLRGVRRKTNLAGHG